MIDTIKAYQDLENIGLTEKQAAEYFSSISPKIAWGYPTKTNSQNQYAAFRMWISHNKLMLQGSVCKLYHGNNVQSLSREQTAEALELLQNLLKFKIDGFILSRVDFSENINTNGNVSRYIDAIEGIDKWNTDKHSVKEDTTGKYFNQSQKSVLLYNKPREINHKRRTNRSKFPINIEKLQNREIEDQQIKLRGNNILRIECRYLKDVSGLMKQKNVKLIDLGKKDTYNFLVREWFKTVCKFKYRENIIPDLENIKGVRDLERALLIGGIAHFGGVAALLKAVRKFKSPNPAVKSKKSRIAKRINELGNNTMLDSFGKELYLEVRRKAIKLALIQIGKRAAN